MYKIWKKSKRKYLKVGINIKILKGKWKFLKKLKKIEIYYLVFKANKNYPYYLICDKISNCQTLSLKFFYNFFSSNWDDSIYCC